MRQLDNWIQAYLVYTDESESPEEFHRWVALSIIAGALRRRSHFNMGYFLLYPNMYIVLVSPAGKCKKSTSMRIGRSTIEPIEGIQYSSDSTTRERLIQDLSQAYQDGHSSMSAFSSEFASLLTSSGMDMVIFLTDIYDSPSEWSHKTKSGGTNNIKAPCLNLLGATTPDWMATGMPLQTVGIGLISRTIFVYQNTPRVRDPFPTLSAAQMDLYKLLCADLAQITELNGEFTLTPDGKDYYTHWYKNRTVDPNESGDPRLAGYFERKPMHLLKMGMVISAAQRDDMTISRKDLTDAMNILRFTEGNMVQVFANVGKNPLNIDIEDVRTAINNSPNGLTQGELLERFKHSVRKDELSEVLDTLIVMNKIVFNDKRFVSL